MESFTQEVFELAFAYVLKNPLIQRFVEEKGFTIASIIEDCMAYTDKHGMATNQSTSSFVFTLDYAKSILRPGFSTGLILDGKHCINIHPRRTTVDKPPHKACATECGGIFCDKCYKASKHETIVKNYEAGKFSLADYAKKKTIAAISDAKSYCRQVGFGKHDVEDYTKKRQLQCVVYRYDRSLLYDAKGSRVVLRHITNSDLVKEFRTVGIDRHNDGKISLLTISDVAALRDTSVVFDITTLDEEAAGEVEAMIAQ